MATGDPAKVPRQTLPKDPRPRGMVLSVTCEAAIPGVASADTPFVDKVALVLDLVIDIFDVVVVGGGGGVVGSGCFK